MSLRKHLYELHASSSTELPVRKISKAHLHGFSEKIKRSRSLAQYSEKVLGVQVSQNDQFDSHSALIDRIVGMFLFAGVSETDLTSIVEEFIKHIRTPFDCEALENKTLAKYIGFVDLRTNSPKSPIAMALLVPPRDLRHDREATIIQGMYGRLFGGHTFPCLPFSMHDPTTGGAYCSVAALIMTLTILADRGAQIVGSYDLTLAALSVEAPELPDSPGRRIFPVEGLNFGQIQNLLNSHICSTSSLYREYSFDLSGRRSLSRLIDAYVSARCPVILGVHTSIWNHKDQGEAHTLVVVGVRRSRTSRHDITDLISHDPSTAPYIVRPVDECFRAASPLNPGTIPVIFSADRSIEFHAASCLEYIYENHREDHDRYLLHFASKDWDNQGMSDLLTKQGNLPSSDYEIRLVHRDDILRLVGKPNQTSVESRHCAYDRNSQNPSKSLLLWIGQVVVKLPDGWYWCISMFNDSKLEVLWFLSTQKKKQDQSEHENDRHSESDATLEPAFSMRHDVPVGLI
jgi:hypothetical protein